MSGQVARIGRRAFFASKPLKIGREREAAPFNGNAFLPAVAVIPLRQHSGEAARPVIPPGSLVREGQVIAVPRGENSAYVHASIPGVLREYRTVPLCSGREERAAVIELSGSFELSGKPPEARSLDGASAEWLLSMIENFSILRTFDGSCSPLSFLIRSFRREFFSSALPSESRASGGILALRMHDFDPSCRVDSFLAKSWTETVLEGCVLVAKSLDVRRVFLFFENRKAFASSGLAAHKALEGFEVKSAGGTGVYPSGAEHFCKIEASKAFGEGRPENVFCINPWTAFSVFNALKHARPLLHRPVLVAGSAIKTPQILNVRVGTRVRDLVGQCGGFAFEPSKVVAGGLISGKALHDLDTPVDMSTDALYFFERDESRFYSVHRCVHCGRCLRICPARLDPARLAAQVQAGGGAKREAARCIFCGTCAAVCPARIPLHCIIKGTTNPNEAALAKGGRGGQN